MQHLLPKRYTRLIKSHFLQRHDVDFWLCSINPLWTFKRPTAQVVKATRHGQFISLTLRCNQQVDFGQAGQHHPISIEIEGRRYQRQYSLTRLDDKHLLLTAKKLPQGLVSNRLYNANLGDLIELGTPYGCMTIDPQVKSVILLAAGSGITPIYSLLHDLIKNQHITAYNIHLLYWQKYAEDAIFFQQFQQWQQQFPHFKVQLYLTQEPQSEFYAQRLNAQHLATFDLVNSQILVCGSAGFVADAQQLCANASHFQSEAFSVPHLHTLDEHGEVQVTLLKSGKTVTLATNQSLLSALEQADIKPKFGCRMGICNHCSCHKISGSTHNLLDHSENHEINQDIRICVNRATSDLVLDL